MVMVGYTKTEWNDLSEFVKTEGLEKEFKEMYDETIEQWLNEPDISDTEAIATLLHECPKYKNRFFILAFDEDGSGGNGSIIEYELVLNDKDVTSVLCRGK